MKTDRSRRLLVQLSIVTLTAGLLGCEGLGRRHDPRLGLDVASRPPLEDAPPGTTQFGPEQANFPDLVEQMLAGRETLLATRSVYFEQLMELERAYLLAGDTVKANWARRQRGRLEDVDVEAYPYLTAAPPEHRVDVAPEQQIPEADAIYDGALALLNEFRSVPMVGFLEHNKRKARKAAGLFRRVLREYPKSDKVDDSAFYCGEIYKEYLREDDPDNELAVRYYKWAFALDPMTPHNARFQCAVVYDFRRHDRVRALELYHQVLETEENGDLSNMRFAAGRIDQLTDDEFSPLRPRVGDARVETGGPEIEEAPVTAIASEEPPGEPDHRPSP